jgi:ABC-type polysaccharide/polyol phosphate transport system ATPase subunit
MQARMAFSVATAVQPEILIIDEALSVGDAAFQRKCSNRIQEMLKGDTTLLLVSHSSSTIKELCENAIWLRNGEVAMTGTSEDVCAAYAEYYK